jgi:hypothetical protein
VARLGRDLALCHAEVGPDDEHLRWRIRRGEVSSWTKLGPAECEAARLTSLHGSSSIALTVLSSSSSPACESSSESDSSSVAAEGGRGPSEPRCEQEAAGSANVGRIPAEW